MNVILNVFQGMSACHSDWSEAKWRNPLNNVSGKEQSLRDTSTSLRFAQYDKRERSYCHPELDSGSYLEFVIGVFK